jgi:hypothetical protein
MSEYGGFEDPNPTNADFEAYSAAGGIGGYNSPQYSQFLADRQRGFDAAYEASPEGQAMSAYHQRRAESRGSDKGTFNIIAGIFAAVAVVLTAGTALGVFAAAGGLEGAVAAGVAEGAIEGGAAEAAVAEAAPAAAAVEAGGVAAGGGAAGTAEAAAPSLFSSIIDGATSVYDAVSGAIETVGELTNISGPLSTAAQEAGVPSTVADLGAKTVVGAGRGALTSAIQGQDPGLGALGGAVSGLVGGGTRALLGPSGLGLGTTGFEGGITGTVAGAAGGAASGAARAAATGADIGQAALRGAATGGGSGFTNYLLSDALGLGNTVGAFGGLLASNLIGGALAPNLSGPSGSSGRSSSRRSAPGPSPMGGGPAGGGPSGRNINVNITNEPSGGTTTTGSPTTISSTALSSLLSTGTDPGYSSPISGDSSLDSDARPAPWNTASLKTTDPTGSSYG